MDYLRKIEKNGFYGQYGGAFVPEVLRETFIELTAAYEEARADEGFWGEYARFMAEYSGRPTPLTFAANLTETLGGAKIYLKREDLNHTGAHKANNVMGQGLLVRRMGKKRVIAETGAGQHGVATATMAAKLGLECVIYMGAHDVHRQRPNVFWMEQLGAEVVPVTAGTRILKDAINEAFRDWTTNMKDTHYVLGTACGPHPFPSLVAWLQSIIGREAKAQMLKIENRPPDKVFACVGGGSNSIGIFSPFLEDPGVELVGAEAGGLGMESGKHAVRILSPQGQIGLAQGYVTKFLQNSDGQMLETHSVSAGLDYVGISPILAHLADEKRVRFEFATDEEAVNALKTLIRAEGIIPALESSHALAVAMREAAKMPKDQIVAVSLSGRGDKDIFTVAEALGDRKWKDFIAEKARQNS